MLLFNHTASSLGEIQVFDILGTDMQWASKQKGFTIVELLVVIVVIAILATITIVSYNGIQNQAKHVAIISAVDAWTKIIEIERVQSGSYPATFRQNSEPPSIEPLTEGGTLYGCLASEGSLPAKGNFPENACMVTSNDGGATYTTMASILNTDTLQKLKVHAGQLPQLPMGPTVHLGAGTPSEPSMEVRGIVYLSNETGAVKQAVMIYYYEGDFECPRGTRDTMDIGGVETSACSVTLK